MAKHENGAEQRDYGSLWTHAGNKFVIGTLHGTTIEIVAQYNPKELARQAAATWTPHPNTSAKHAPTGESQMWSTYGTTAPRTMTVELLFDGYEEGIPVAPIVADLERLTIPVDMTSRDPSKRRPQLCVAVWGKQQLRCVVQSVATKLTMFDASGEPLRATCTVVLMEVDVVAMMKSDVNGAIDRVSKKSGDLPSTKPGHQWPYPPEDSKPTRVPPPNRSSSAPAPAASSTVGKPSAQINPAALDGAQPGTGPLFKGDSAPATGKPSAQVDPHAMDGEGDHVFVGEQPAPKTGTPSTQVDPDSMDGKSPVFGGKPSAQVDPQSMDGKSDVFGEEPAPDAVSGADPESPDAKRMAVYKDLE